MTETMTEFDGEERALLALDDALASGIALPDAMARTVARHPQYARLIGDHAVHQALVASDAAILTAEEARRAEERAVTVLARQREIWQARRAASPSAAFAGIFAAAKARGLAREALASTLGIGATILTKLERRLVDASTIPSTLVERLASELGQSNATIWTYLAGSPTLASQANYRSRQTPRTSAATRESFSQSLATAARLGEVPPDDQAHWQAEIASGRVGRDESRAGK